MQACRCSEFIKQNQTSAGAFKYSDFVEKTIFLRFSCGYRDKDLSKSCKGHTLQNAY